MCEIFNRAITFLRYSKCGVQGCMGMFFSSSQASDLFVSLNSERPLHVIPIMEAAMSAPFPPAEGSSLLI